MTEENKLTTNTIIWGLIIPVIIGIVILIFPAIIGPALNKAFPMTSDLSFIPQILTHGFALMLMYGIPLFLGLNWNKWAGGSAGFLCGTLYYTAFTSYQSITYSYNYFQDPSLFGYIVNGILIGYIAGALSNKSYKFKRMLGAAMTASIATGIIQFVLNYTVAAASWMTRNDPAYALFIVMLPQIILGILVPIVARITTGSELWHA